jgi:type I restriction enzyme, S subunit
MRSNYKKIGDYIQLVDERNRDLSVDMLLGLSVDKVFIPSVANTVGSNMANYKIIRKDQFACSLMQVRRDKKIPVAMLKDYNEAIISQAYPVFEVKNKNELLPEYLMMWMSRSEFDREACFYAIGGVRGSLEWDDFCNMRLPVPSIDKQREIVQEYYTIIDRIKLNEQFNKKLEEAAQAIYKQWFIDFECPISEDYATKVGKPELAGQPYKSSGCKMVWNDELGLDIPEGWEYGTLKDLASYSSNRINVSSLDVSTYISTENMLTNRGGIKEAAALPNVKTVARFYPGDILISNIRPYFKKIWSAEFEGGCSNDILCITPRDNTCVFYLYQLLEKDSFFDYVMSGSKGTKMPRGDKTWIMNYPVLMPTPDLTKRFKKIAIMSVNTRSSKRSESVSLSVLSSLLLSKMTKVEVAA